MVLVMLVALSGTSFLAAAVDMRVCLSWWTEGVVLLMRPQASLVLAFVILACVFAGDNGTVGNISNSSCRGDHGMSIMAADMPSSWRVLNLLLSALSSSQLATVLEGVAPLETSLAGVVMVSVVCLLWWTWVCLMSS